MLQLSSGGYPRKCKLNYQRVNELVVSKSEDGLRIGILQEKKIVELHHEKLTEEFSVGDLFLGIVRKIVSGLNAAFIDVGHPRDAFLHYLDLGPQVKSLLKFVKAARGARQGRLVPIEAITPLKDINNTLRAWNLARMEKPLLWHQNLEWGMQQRWVNQSKPQHLKKDIKGTLRAWNLAPKKPLLPLLLH